MNIIIAILAIASVYFIFRRFKQYKKPGYTNVIDPKSQELYDQKKYGDDGEKSLDLKERIELSWQFLTNITKQVLSKFSIEDQAQVTRIGHDLVQSGMKYDHNVEMEVKIIQRTSKARTVVQSKSEDISRSR